MISISILFRSQGEFINNESDDITSTINSVSSISENLNQSNKTILLESSTENLFNTLNDLIDVTTTSSDYSETSLSSLFLSSADYYESRTTEKNDLLFGKEQWFNYNQISQQNSSGSSIVWSKINDESLNSSTYIIKSGGECMNRMCRVKLKYNGSISNNIDGCLSFILWTRGQPVGQLWIEEDEEQENFSQKIQLTNSSLHVEHSLKSNIKNLSIDARILFRNSKIDSITLSNLNVKWHGPCPKYRSMTSSPNISLYQSTFEQEFLTLTSDDYYQTSLFTINNTFENTQDSLLIQSSTVKSHENLKNKKRFFFIDQSNIQWILISIILFCLLIILLSFLYGLWTIQEYHRFIWHVRFNYPIQFISRRSIRSSIKSENKIERLSQTSDDLFHIDYQQEHFDSFSTNSSRSMSSPFNSYF
ncbi:unnamed protein product [Rotaria socialis]|uniref:Uncharacterized protein n=1 Tax=Rotaria socialis TaxID=392032 RepID=A0A817TIA0_9BILA|nr:unnamed protein product [Rotaria socialis]CAF4889096.1 unnamed protein product [Rotaria socialis]